MTYEFVDKSKLQNRGAIATVFPGTDLDEAALYTIENDKPPFLVPLRYVRFDDNIECTYFLDNRIKLKFLQKTHTPSQYVELWEKLLRPLIDCRDWFMNPLSFVLDYDYLYYDEATKSICYLYVPAKTPCAGPDAIRELMTAFSKDNNVTDPNLKSKVLELIIDSVSPEKFLNSLAKYKYLPQSGHLGRALQDERQKPVQVVEEKDNKQANPAPEKPYKDSGNDNSYKEVESENDPLNISFQDAGTRQKERKPDKKKTKVKTNEKHLFKKCNKRKGVQLFGKSVESELKGAEMEPDKSDLTPGSTSVDFYPEKGPLTTLDDEVRKSAKPTGLRSMSGQVYIKVDIPKSGYFTIGRFDTDIKQKQSDFEFAADVKGVSRHHAAIQRLDDGRYVIYDLTSAFGTYVDGQKLLPNVSHELTPGCYVEFGSSKQKFVWEEGIETE